MAKSKIRTALVIAGLFAIAVTTMGAAGGCRDYPSDTTPAEEIDPDWATDWNELDQKNLPQVRDGNEYPGSLPAGHHQLEFRVTVWDPNDVTDVHTVAIPATMTLTAYDKYGLARHQKGDGTWENATYVKKFWTGGGWSHYAVVEPGIVRVDVKFDVELQRGWFVYCASFMDHVKQEDHEISQDTLPKWGNYEPNSCIVSVTPPQDA